MKKLFFGWGERYLYAPDPLQRLIALFLMPLSWLYCGVMYLRFMRAKAVDYGIPVVSVGNLTVGGSGKTPLVTALASRYENAAVVLRGYGRQSRGLVVVSDGKSVLCDVRRSGDEAMIYAHKLPGAAVIVSERREAAVQKAKEMGCGVVFLDDGYGKHRIRKLDLLIDVDTSNDACLPSGPYRERLWPKKEAVMVKEGGGFARRVSVKEATPTMVLVTAIARPQRLDPYLPEVAGKYYFPDHHFFTREELEEIIERHGATSVLVTYKDYVKIADFGLNVSLLELTLDVDGSLREKIDRFVESYR